MPVLRFPLALALMVVGCRPAVPSDPKTTDPIASEPRRLQHQSPPRATSFRRMAGRSRGLPDPLDGTQPHGRGPRIGRDFSGARLIGSAGEQPQPRRVIGQFNRQFGRRCAGGASGEYLLDQPIFKRLVGQDHNSAADPDRSDRSGYRTFECRKLGVV